MYSIADQNELALEIQSLNNLATTIAKIHDVHGMRSMVDIVLNHTAADSPWLQKHPEATYGPHNCLHLKAPEILDAALCSFSQKLALESPSINNDDDLRHVMNQMRPIVFGLNLHEHYPSHHRHTIDDALHAALRNIENTVRYERLQQRLGPITEASPLVQPYFTRIGDVAMANNGFIWNHDPLDDFIGPHSLAYLRRDIIIWSDCVKLNYGADQSSWLWGHMESYVRSMASIFHGLRLDNAHSTPLRVAEYMLQCAREERPDIYVIAELFTGSEATDRMFETRLGLDALVREAMQASSAEDLARLVTLYSAKPAIFYDCTHDNETPAQKRTAKDALPNAAIVAFTNCAIASVRGYDELVPRNLSVVTERRPYATQTSTSSTIPSDVLNSSTMSCTFTWNYPATHVLLKGSWDQWTDATALVKTPDGFACALELPFGSYQYKFIVDGEWRADLSKPMRDINNHVVVESSIHSTDLTNAKMLLNTLHSEIHAYTETRVARQDQVIIVQRYNPHTFESMYLIAHTAFDEQRQSSCSFTVDGSIEPMFAISLNVPEQTFQADAKTINGLRGDCHVYSGLQFAHTFSSLDGSETVINYYLDAGSIIVFRAKITPPPLPPHDLLDTMTLLDLNALLYRCAAESDTSPYVIPGYGPLVYSGLQGIVSAFKQSRDAVYHHLREGDWLMQYTAALHPWLTKAVAIVTKSAPLKWAPAFFERIVTDLYTLARERAALQMNLPADELVRDLAMGSVQMWGLSEGKASMAAGLPHFSTGYMRTWGRDTFIAMRGLLIKTQRWGECVEAFKAFGSVVRNGLVPNLLDGGKNPRYNARDATWWFLQALQDYVKAAPDGVSILSMLVPRHFPPPESEPSSPTHSHWCFAEIIQHIMEHHANGIHFREFNAGPAIDSHMSSDGFNIRIQFEPETGMLYGGSASNCGTWMDKMGHHGVPATPRDGAAIEIIGLLKSTLRWLQQLHLDCAFPYEGVSIDGAEFVTYVEWDQRLSENFERLFWVPLDSTHKYTNRCGIYKDTVGSTAEWSDFQLRPNMCVAMVVAPELFKKDNVIHALKVAEVLLGPLGMKTLDPSDMNYRPDYDNSNAGPDPSLQLGFNYHQGPEWLWPIGYYWMAKLLHDPENTTHETVTKALMPHREMLKKNAWASLPELTNGGGAFCKDSCPAQAWSLGTILEAVLY